MAVQLFTKKTVGVGGDYATIKLWWAAYPNVGSERWDGSLIDALYDEDAISLGDPIAENKGSSLSAAPGVRPVIKPDVNLVDNVRLINVAGFAMRLIGVVLDGANKTTIPAGDGLIETIYGGIVLFCEVRNSPGPGVYMNSSGFIFGCLIHNNAGDGVTGTGTTRKPVVAWCGLHKNGGYGINAPGTSNTTVVNCLLFGNTLGSQLLGAVVFINNDQMEWHMGRYGGFSAMDDQVYTDAALTDPFSTVLENQTATDYFTDYANNDFTLKAGSPALKKGPPIAYQAMDAANGKEDNRIAAIDRDVYGNVMQLDYADRYDMGPHQKSYAKTIVTVNINSPIVAAIEQQVDIP